MNIQKFVADLSESGIEISLKGGDLKINGRRDMLTPERISLIKRHKMQLIDYLRSEAAGDEENISDEHAPYKTYNYPDGRVLSLSREEFHRVVDAVRWLIKMDNEESQDGLKGAVPNVA